MQRMISEGNLGVGLLHTGQEELKFLLLRRGGERTSSNGGEHFGTPVVVGDRHHALHYA